MLAAQTDENVAPEAVESLADVDLYESKEQVSKALIEFLVTRFELRYSNHYMYYRALVRCAIHPFLIVCKTIIVKAWTFL